MNNMPHWLSPFWRYSTKKMPFASQKTKTITFAADGTVFAFIGWGESGCFHGLDCSLGSGMKWWTHDSSIVTHLSRKLSGLVSKRFKVPPVIFSRVLLINRQIVSVPQRANSFLISRPSVRMEWTLSWEIPKSLVMYFSVTRRSQIKTSWTLETISEVATVTGLPGQGVILEALSATLKFCHPPFYRSI